MDYKYVQSTSPYEGKIGFSRALQAGNRIYVAGTAAIGPNGETVYLNNIYEQTKYCIHIIEKSIKELGANLSNVVRTRIIVKHGQEWSSAAKAHYEMFKNIKPVTTVFMVPSFIEEDWLVEVEAECEL
ncbi:MAG: RidA family protein [Bacillota bacterium]